MKLCNVNDFHQFRNLSSTPSMECSDNKSNTIVCSHCCQCCCIWSCPFSLLYSLLSMALRSNFLSRNNNTANIHLAISGGRRRFATFANGCARVPSLVTQPLNHPAGLPQPGAVRVLQFEFKTETSWIMHHLPLAPGSIRIVGQAARGASGQQHCFSKPRALRPKPWPQSMHFTLGGGQTSGMSVETIKNSCSPLWIQSGARGLSGLSGDVKP